MTNEDLERFASLVYGLAANFGTDASKAMTGMWFRALKECSIDDFERAAMAILAQRKYAKMPTLAELIECMGGGSTEDKSEVQASKVLGAIRQYGHYSSVVFDDAVTMAVIDQGFGGWPRLCQELTEDQERWWRREFVHIYAAYQHQGIKRGGVLAGYLQWQNEMNNRPISPPQLIGDPARAQKVQALPVAPVTAGPKPLAALPWPVTVDGERS